jgi:hypothetical protein
MCEERKKIVCVWWLQIEIVRKVLPKPGLQFPSRIRSVREQNGRYGRVEYHTLESSPIAPDYRGQRTSDGENRGDPEK